MTNPCFHTIYLLSCLKSKTAGAAVGNYFIAQGDEFRRVEVAQVLGPDLEVPGVA